MPQERTLEDLWKSAGARFDGTSPAGVPSSFGDPAKEREAALRGAALFDLSWRDKLAVSGGDRIPLLHNLLTNDIQGLKAGGGCYAGFLTAQGKIVADMRVYLFEDRVLLDCEPGLSEKIRERLGRFVIMEDVVMEPVRDLGHLLIAGPEADALMRNLCGTRPPRGFSHSRVTLGGRSVTAVKTGLPGIAGWEILVSAADAAAAAEEIMKAAVPAGYDAWESLRIEAGWLRYGIDMTEEDTLPETGVDALAASETKGCYPGQEVVARTNTYKGHSKKMSRFLFSAGQAPEAGGLLYCGDAEAGRITSISPLTGPEGRAALGYVRKGFFESALTAQASDGGRVPALRRQPADPA